MNLYIMRAHGKTYIALGQDCVQAASMVPVPMAEISVSGSVPADTADAFVANLDYGSILLLDKHGNSLGDIPVRRN